MKILASNFRYLTIWGLTGAMVSSYLLYRSKRNNLPETYRAFVSAVAVLNAMVVFLYWKLYFIDPSLVNYSGSIVWFQEYYLHALGPLLIILDALFFKQIFLTDKKRCLNDSWDMLALCRMDRSLNCTT